MINRLGTNAWQNARLTSTKHLPTVNVATLQTRSLLTGNTVNTGGVLSGNNNTVNEDILTAGELKAWDRIKGWFGRNKNKIKFATSLCLGILLPPWLNIIRSVVSIVKTSLAGGQQAAATNSSETLLKNTPNTTDIIANEPIKSENETPVLPLTGQNPFGVGQVVVNWGKIS